MEIAEGIWSRDARKYSDRLLFTVGKVVVGTVEHPFVEKGNPKFSRASLKVPGITLKEADYENDEQAKARVEKSFRVWLSWLEARP